MKIVNFKTAHVEWDPGSTHFSRAFERCLDMDEMREMIIERFIAYPEMLNRRSNYNIESVCGRVIYVPHAVAEDIFQIVRRFFYRALEIMERVGEGELEEGGSAAGKAQPSGQIKRRLEV